MEQFVYTKNHINAVKKYKTMRVLFLALGCFVLALQSIAWLVVWLKNMPIKISDMWFVGITLIYSLYFVISQIFLIIHSRRILERIKKEGSYTTLRIKIRLSDKTTFGGTLTIFAKVLFVIFIILLAIVVTNFISDIVNWGKIILKMPLLVLCAVEFLNLSAELNYQAMLEKLI